MVIVLIGRENLLLSFNKKIDPVLRRAHFLIYEMTADLTCWMSLVSACTAGL